MNERLLFKASAIVEISAGLAFFAAPILIIGLLLGGGLGTTGVAVARVLGIGLLSIGIAGWESQGQDVRLAPRRRICVEVLRSGALLAYKQDPVKRASREF